jgi:hypothetical protein
VKRYGLGETCNSKGDTKKLRNRNIPDVVPIDPETEADPRLLELQRHNPFDETIELTLAEIAEGWIGYTHGSETHPNDRKRNYTAEFGRIRLPDDRVVTILKRRYGTIHGLAACPGLSEFFSFYKIKMRFLHDLENFTQGNALPGDWRSLGKAGTEREKFIRQTLRDYATENPDKRLVFKCLADTRSDLSAISVVSTKYVDAFGGFLRVQLEEALNQVVQGTGASWSEKWETVTPKKSTVYYQLDGYNPRIATTDIGQAGVQPPGVPPRSLYHVAIQFDTSDTAQGSVNIGGGLSWKACGNDLVFDRPGLCWSKVHVASEELAPTAGITLVEEFQNAIDQILSNMAVLDERIAQAMSTEILLGKALKYLGEKAKLSNPLLEKVRLAYEQHEFAPHGEVPKLWNVIMALTRVPNLYTSAAKASRAENILSYGQLELLRKAAGELLFEDDLPQEILVQTATVKG